MAGALLAVSVLCGAMQARGQNSAEAPGGIVRAAFLFNFVKFTEWPALAPDATVLVCVAGDDEVADALVAIIRTQMIGDHQLELRQSGEPEAWPSCHLLFVSQAEARRAPEALKAVQRYPVLTVSDARGFARDSGIVELFVQDNRMRFAINVSAAERAGLRISSRLLGLAEIIGGGHDR